MEEEDCDYRTPVGKVIKHLNTLCKKPQIDDELSKALDLFKENLDEQDKYLVNGIFRTNFSEAALFLQSSSELYGRKIDLLWDQLLEFHTRLIQYDCENEKENGKKINLQAIEQLEERRNRYKRKKKFKVVLKELENEGQVLYDTDKDKENSKGTDPQRPDETISETFDDDYDSGRLWRGLEWQNSEIIKIPEAIYIQQLQKYQIKNYHVLKSMDFDILDPEDGEFNTKYSRIPGWHHIMHVFEYNNKGLMPDKGNLIAKLRLCAYLRIKFLKKRNIPYNTPFEQYKEEYIAYRNKFFEEEAKKWQNMPLDTMEDLHKQLQYLARKEREERSEVTTNSEKDKVRRLSVKESNYISLDSSSSEEESGFEKCFEVIKDGKSELTCRLEKLPSDVVNIKLRQDSGFYDGIFDNDADCDNAADCDTDYNTNTVNCANLDADSCAATVNVNIANTNDINTNGNEKTVNRVIDENGNINVESNTNVNAAISEDSICTTNITTNNENAQYNKDCTDEEISNVDRIQASSLLNDHDYCFSAETRNGSDENNLNTTDIENVSNALADESSTDNQDISETAPLSDLRDETHCDMSCQITERNTLVVDSSSTDTKTAHKKLNVTVEETINMPLCCGGSSVIPKLIKVKERREKVIKQKESENVESPPKRRKLSQKQIEKLLKCKVPPVKFLKFEKFYSVNYQPQLGEGETLSVDYESEVSDTEDVDFEKISNEDHLKETDATHSNLDDNCSINSEHDYCQPPDDNPQNDSGFADLTNSQISVDDTLNTNREETLLFDDSLLQDNTGKDQNADQAGHSQCVGAEGENCLERDASTAVQRITNAEDEYESLMALLRDGGEDESATLRCRTQQELREREKRESKARVDQWRDTINPILRNLKEADFDIHAYGTQIMDGMEINEKKPFGAMVNGKSSAEVVRFFISSLQLANTYNVEICGAKQGELSNETFELKLLKKDRYHEHLDVYQAPSEETFRERMNRVKNMHASTKEPPVGPKAKNPKLSDVCLKKRSKTTQSKEKSLDKRQPAENASGSNSLNTNSTLSPAVNRYKGKSIIKKQNRNESSDMHDLNPKPSTSRHVHWSPDAIPSTSYTRPSSPVCSELPPGIQSGSSDLSRSPQQEGLALNKRRRVSTETSFRERYSSNRYSPEERKLPAEELLFQT